MTTYKGFDVLEVEPSRNPGREDQIRSGFVPLDSKTGKRKNDIRDADGIVTSPFLWFAEGRPAVTAIRTFLTARRGRAIPAWVPTYDADLILAADVLAGSGSLTIEGSGYTKHLFPHLSRRTLQIFDRATWTRQYVRVTNAVENLDGTETLTLDVAVPGALAAATTLVSFLLLCRLTTDRATIVHHTPELATSTLRFSELTKEVPA